MTPTLSVAAVQLTLICVLDAAVAEGAPGAVGAWASLAMVCISLIANAWLYTRTSSMSPSNPRAWSLARLPMAKVNVESSWTAPAPANDPPSTRLPLR